MAKSQVVQHTCAKQDVAQQSHMLQLYSKKKITQQALLYPYLVADICGGSYSSFISWSVSVSYLIAPCCKILAAAKYYTLTNHYA
jgi:hypothetical protein